MSERAPADRLPRPWLTLGGLGILAAANAALVAWATTLHPGPAAAVPDPASTLAIQQLGARLLAPGTPEGVLAAVKALREPGVSYELATGEAGQARVIAATHPSRVGQAPDADLARVLADGKARTERQPTRLLGLFAASVRPAAPSPAPTATPAPVGEARTYVVRPGDTLYKISRDQYGDDSMFHAIWDANRSVIPNRSSLVSGLRLTLPPREDGETTPAATSAPAVAAPVRYALRLSRVVAAPVPADARTLPLALAGTTLATWLLAWLLLDRRRRQELAFQRRGLLAEVAHRFRPARAPFDREALRSPWVVEHAASHLQADEPGGCLTDHKRLSDARVGLFIADATGWNVPALVTRGVVGLLWRALAAEGLPPERTLLALNHHLADHLVPGDHVTAFYAQIDTLSGAVAFASASHTGAYVLGRRGGLTMLNTRGVPLGVPTELAAQRIEPGQVRLAEGESLLLFTEGLLKAESPDGEPFGLERLEKCLRERPGCNADEVVATVRQALAAFTRGGGVDDEAAIVCLRLVSPAIGSVRRVAEAPLSSNYVHTEDK